MTSREFRIWLEGFLDNTKLKDVKLRDGYDTGYNYLTMLKTISNKLETVNDRYDINQVTETLIPTPGPNPFTVTCEKQKINNL
jgi:hypothetical protein|tara:strand:+ start:336 stop:584 length:249 start_codon:yes stop_codon:yes gene_type:complete